MVFLMALLAFAVDIGYMLHARTELQRTADAAALSAGWDYVHEGAFDGDEYLTEAGLEVQNEETHGVLKNVNSYSSA